MSTPQQKIEVITEWLERNAKLGRLTNMVEVQVNAGLELAIRGYREDNSAQPVSRTDTATALAAIAEGSFKNFGILLPALVVHYADKQPGHRFVAWAASVGLLTTPEFDPDGNNEVEIELDDNGVPRWEVTPEALELHADQVAKIFAAFVTPAALS